MDIRRICLWSGPRNVSTALMYAFAQRSDTQVIDEPLYAHYLAHTGVDHPGRQEVLDAQDQDGERVVRRVILGSTERPVLFMKQMAHHLEGLDWSFLQQTVNVLLIRDPAEMLPSLVHQIPNPTLRDTGLGMQQQLLAQLHRWGQRPPVLDARQLLLDPPSVLRQLCGRLDIPFDEAMLSWPAKPLPEDGVWAPHWYHNVHRSTGFQPYRSKNVAVPSHVEPLLASCAACYRELYAHALLATPPAA